MSRNKMLTFNVNPEVSLSTPQWEFALGMHFSEITGILQQQRRIQNCIVTYNENLPLEEDFCINLSNDGILLVFDSYKQCLKSIEVYNMKLVKLTYLNSVFNSHEILPSIEQIDCCFGATVPAVYDKDKKMLNLNFPGLSFFFPCDKKPIIKTGMVQIDLGASLIASEMKIYSGKDPHDLKLPDEPYLHISENSYAQSIHVLRQNGRTQGLKLNMFLKDESVTEEDQPCFKSKPPIKIYFGTLYQEILSKLGAPSKIFYKYEDKMKIHRPKKSANRLQRSDFFLNYFSLGLDILIDAEHEVAKKFLLHTNYPGHYNFNSYRRCNFYLPICIEKDPRDMALIDFPQQINVSSFTLWKTILSKINIGHPSIVLNRSSSKSTFKAFGSTYCKPYQDVIFEIIPNGHLACITLFQLNESA